MIERIALPGIGAFCDVATTAQRQRIGVIVHRTGRRDLVVYDADDPQSAANVVALDPAEARCLADLLADTTTVDHVGGSVRWGHAMSVAQIRVPSDAHGYTLTPRELGAQDHSVRVVAIIRQHQLTAAPHAGFTLHHDDTLVTVGDAAGIAALAARLSGDAR